MSEPNTTFLLIFSFFAIPIMIALMIDDLEKRRAAFDDDEADDSEDKPKPRKLSPQEQRDQDYYLEQKINKAKYKEKYPFLCYVCKSPINAVGAVPLVDEIACQYCGKTNVILKSGASNTPERLALYLKYDGFDGNWATVGGLLGNLSLERQAKLEENEAQYAAGNISEEVFKKNRKQIKLENNRKKKPFEKQKKEELRAIHKVEDVHRRRVILRTRSR